jgi:Holliday junction DNA helicase RuvA
VIASLNGQVTAKAAGQVVLEVSGVGYALQISKTFENQLSIGDSLRVHTRLIVREDAFTLFGFESEAHAQVFDTLRSVSGVGPKLALAIISQLGLERISLAIANQDDGLFSSVSGIGPKTAKLLTVALEGKLMSSPAKDIGNNGLLDALIGLGWREKDASEALESAAAQSSGTSDKDLLRSALVILAASRSDSKSNK